MTMRKYFSCVCAAVLILSMLCGCGQKKVQKKSSFDEEIQSTDVEDIFIAQNEKLKLEFNKTTQGIQLEDIKTGSLFGSNPVNSGEEQFDELGMPIKRHPQVESTLFIEYLDVKTNTTAQLISYNAAVKGGRTVVKEIENGITVEYYFDDAQFMIPIDYVLRDESVAITLDPKKIQEGDNMLINVSVMPFFCSVKNTEKDGYLVYPSGSGTLVYPKEISQPGETYSAEVYGTDYAKEIWDKITTEKAIRLPIFGAKSGNGATLAVIEEGAESSNLKMTVGSTSVGYSSAYVTYQLRGYTANIKELYNNRYYKGNVYADNMIEMPLTIGFYPLTGKDANYSKMAEVYRDYLNKTVGKGKTDNSSKLDITFVGGAMTVKSFLGIPYETLFPTTTVSQVNNILKDFKDVGVEVSSVRLSGFTQNGIDSNKLGGNFRLDGKLGKSKQLDSLKAFCKESGTALYLDFNTVTFDESSKGFSAYFDSSTRANRKPAKDYNFDIAVLGRDTENSLSLLARDKFTHMTDRITKAAEKLGIDGIGLSNLSSMTYSDYTDKQNTDYYAKAGFGKQVSEIYNKVSQNGKKILSFDANAFAAAKSDTVMNTPTVSSGAFVFDEDIPLYQMVFRGRTSVSTESVNLVADSKAQLLRAVESGCGLSYTLIADYNTVLLDSASPVFYNSLYSDIGKTIIEDYNLLKEYYEKIGNSELVSHEILGNRLRKTVFANNVTVYVNYSDETLSSPAGEVPAKSFLIGEAKV